MYYDFGKVAKEIVRVRFWKIGLKLVGHFEISLNKELLQKLFVKFSLARRF